MNIAPIAPTAAHNVRKSSTPNFQGVANLRPAFASESTSVIKSAKNRVGKAYDNFVENGIVKYIVAPIMNSDKMLKLTDKLGKSKNMASHMSTAGSFVTTAFYIRQTDKTLNKDAEERKRAKTLELNQGLVTVVSTVLGYTVNGALGNFSKNLGQKFREANQNCPKLSTRMKGFDIAKQLLIFSLMYRYVAPVFVTPLASKISKVMDAKKAEKAAQGAQQPQLANAQPQPQPQKVEVNAQNTAKKA